MFTKNFNPGKWDWSSGNTYLGIGEGGLLGGFGGASLGLGGGAMCMQIGTAKAITSVTF